MSRTFASVKVEGLQGCLKNLDTMETKLAKTIVKDAARAGGRVLLAAVKSDIYKGLHKQTGLLGSGLTVTTGISSSGQRVTSYVKERQVGVAGKSKTAKISLRAATRHAHIGGRIANRFGAFYWRFLEFGTAARANSSGANRGALKATGNVRSAFSASSSAAIDQFRSVLIAKTETEAQNLPRTKGGP